MYEYISFTLIILLIALATIMNNTPYQTILVIYATIIAVLTIIKSIADESRKPQYI